MTFSNKIKAHSLYGTQIANWNINCMKAATKSSYQDYTFYDKLAYIKFKQSKYSIAYMNILSNIKI